MNIDRDEALEFAGAPAAYFGGSAEAMQGLDPERLEALQLAAARLRFAELGGRLAPLQTLAAEQGISTIEQIEDIAPLLFQHTVYKSYPASLLAGNRFTP